MCSTILSILKELREEIHERVDDISVRKLDEVIHQVEMIEGRPGHLVQVERLKLLARALEALPSFLLLVERFFR